MSKKATGIVSYITLIGWLIAFFAGDRQGAKFHLNQSLVLMVVNLVFNVLSTILDKIPVVDIISGIVFFVLGIVMFVFWIMGLVHACKEEEKPLPIIGKIEILK